MTPAAERRRLRAVFLPMGTDANPYQRILATALAAQAVDVIEAERSPVFGPRSLARWNADLIHLHWAHSLALDPRLPLALARSAALRASLAWARRCRTPIVWTAHNAAAHEGHHPRLDARVRRHVAAAAQRVIVHGPAARATLLASVPADADRVEVVPHAHYGDWYAEPPARASARETLGLPAEAFVVLHLGYLKSYKGTLGLVDAFVRAAPADAVLLIAGEPADAAHDADLRQRCSADARVLYRPGFVAPGDVPEHLAAADVCALPYRRILVSGAAVLAGSFGLPCIAPRTGGTTDILGADAAGLYDPEDPDGLAAAIRQAAEDREHLPAHGAALRARVRRWSPDAVAARTRAVYEAAISSS